MSKNKNKGGRLPGGDPAKVPNPKRNAGHGLSPEVIEAIADLPQISTGEWSVSSLAEQLWRNYLGMPADFTEAELKTIANRNIIKEE
jgi:hypothetical protein